MLTIEELKQKVPRYMTNYALFCRECLGYKDMNQKHEELCKFIQFDPHQSLLILMPRYTFKSWILTQGYSLWSLARNPDLRILIYSDSTTKSTTFLQGIKNHIEKKVAGSQFKDYFGNWYDAKLKYNEDQIVIAHRKNASVEPSIDTSGIDSSKVGMHYDLIIFDDIVSDVNATTKAQMDKVYDCYKRALSLLTPTGKVIVVGTRWHYGDAYGRIIAENKSNNQFGIFIIKAQEGEKYNFDNIGENSLTKDFLARQRATQGNYVYSCLYQNDPVDDENALFKIEDIQYYQPFKDFHKKFYITAGVDPAGQGEDFTAITVVGWDDRGNMYLLDAVNEHLKPSQIVERIIRLNYKWAFDRIAIETNFFRGTLEDDLRKAIEEERKNKNFKLFGVTPVMASAKNRTFNRVLALQPYSERKSIWFPGESFNKLPVVFSNLGYQMIQFTADGAKSPHDDLIVSLALNLEVKSKGEAIEQGQIDPTCASAFERKYFAAMMEHNSRVPRKYRRSFQLSLN